MGMCYFVDLGAKFKDRNEAARILREHMENEERGNRVNFHLSEHEDKELSSIDALVRIVLADWPRSRVRISETKDGFVYYSNDFNACYGWEQVMIDAFIAMTPALEDGSSFYISPDNDQYELVVENGSCVRHDLSSQSEES